MPEKSNPIEEIILDYLFSQIGPVSDNKTDIKRLRFIFKAKKALISFIPGLFYTIFVFVPIIVLVCFSPLGKIINPPTTTQSPSSLLRTLLVLVCAAVFILPSHSISFGPIKRLVSKWIGSFKTKIEKYYEQYIDDFVNSLNPILGVDKTIEFPDFSDKKFPLGTITTMGIAEFFIKRLMPESISLALLDHREDIFLVKASMGLSKDTSGKMVFQRDSRLIHWLGMGKGNITRENLKKSIIDNDCKKRDPVDIERIRQDMDRLNADVCTPIYYSSALIGFLGLGRKILGKYTSDDLTPLLYLARHLYVTITKGVTETLNHISTDKGMSETHKPDESVFTRIPALLEKRTLSREELVSLIKYYNQAEQVDKQRLEKLKKIDIFRWLDYIAESNLACEELIGKRNSIIIEGLVRRTKKEVQGHVRTLHEADKVLRIAQRKTDNMPLTSEQKRFLIGGWITFDEEVHNEGLSEDAQMVMRLVFHADAPAGYRLSDKQAHAKRVGKYGRILEELCSEGDIKNRPNIMRFELDLDITDEEVMRHQTEWWIGLGYPDGLKAEEIPLRSRLLAISEAFDIFYDMWKDKEKAVRFIKTLSGIKFDPALVEILENACASGAID